MNYNNYSCSMFFNPIGAEYYVRMQQEAYKGVTSRESIEKLRRERALNNITSIESASTVGENRISVCVHFIDEAKKLIRKYFTVDTG